MSEDIQRFDNVFLDLPVIEDEKIIKKSDVIYLLYKSKDYHHDSRYLLNIIVNGPVKQKHIKSFGKKLASIEIYSETPLDFIPKLPSNLSAFKGIFSSTIKGKFPVGLKELDISVVGEDPLDISYLKNLKILYVTQSPKLKKILFPDNIRELRLLKMPMDILPILPKNLEDLWFTSTKLVKIPDLTYLKKLIRVDLRGTVIKNMETPKKPNSVRISVSKRFVKTRDVPTGYTNVKFDNGIPKKPRVVADFNAKFWFK